MSLFYRLMLIVSVYRSSDVCVKSDSTSFSSTSFDVHLAEIPHGITEVLRKSIEEGDGYLVAGERTNSRLTRSVLEHESTLTTDAYPSFSLSHASSFESELECQATSFVLGCQETATKEDERAAEERHG